MSELAQNNTQVPEKANKHELFSPMFSLTDAVLTMHAIFNPHTSNSAT